MECSNMNHPGLIFSLHRVTECWATQQLIVSFYTQNNIALWKDHGLFMCHWTRVYLVMSAFISLLRMHTIVRASSVLAHKNIRIRNDNFLIRWHLAMHICIYAYHWWSSILFYTVNLYILKSIVCAHLPVGNLYQSRHNDMLISLLEVLDLLSN